ncbi:hypothetical protein QBC39DRAFT_134645 [Podospora conica]|nr:hypothetical protein QBC39DRAFT_134645 [Schizothecium conicum]
MGRSIWQATGVVVVAIAAALLPSRAEAGIPLALPPRYRASMLGARASDNPETVVLADCLDSANIISSQMAYFPGAPSSRPQDVAIVATTPKEAALWVNSKTAARFTATNTVFVANIGPKVAQGKYAGSGNNGYGDFSCWEQYTPKLYKYGDTVCSQVYFCDHRDPPGRILLPSVEGDADLVQAVTAILTPTSSVAAAPSGADDVQAGVSDSSGGLSEAALIAIIVSIVGVAAIAVATAVVLWFRRRLRRQELGEADGSSTRTNRSCCGLFGGKKEQGRDPFQDSSAELPVGHDRNEMPCEGARPRAVELADTSDKFELDAGRDGILWSEAKKESMYAATETKWATERGREQTESIELPLVSPVSPDEETSRHRRGDGLR